jgi:hypothetical protein
MNIYNKLLTIFIIEYIFIVYIFSVVNINIFFINLIQF